MGLGTQKLKARSVCRLPPPVIYFLDPRVSSPWSTNEDRIYWRGVYILNVHGEIWIMSDPRFFSTAKNRQKRLENR
jgi:hypothetical protein